MLVRNFNVLLSNYFTLLLESVAKENDGIKGKKKV